MSATLYKQLCKAIKKGDVNRVKFLLEAKGVDPNPHLPTQKNALEIACCKQNLDIVQLLITNPIHPANPNTLDEDGNSPFETALYTENLELVDLLLRESIEPVNVNYVNDNDGNALSVAVGTCSLSLVKMLLKAGADANLKTKFPENSPMMEAIQSRNVDICKLLLEHGFDPNTCYSLHDAGNITAIDLAAVWGNIHIVKLLHENGADLLSTYESTMDYAIVRGNSLTLEYCMQYAYSKLGDSVNWSDTILTTAIIQNQPTCLGILLRWGIYPSKYSLVSQACKHVISMSYDSVFHLAVGEVPMNNIKIC